MTNQPKWNTFTPIYRSTYISDILSINFEIGPLSLSGYSCRFARPENSSSSLNGSHGGDSVKRTKSEEEEEEEVKRQQRYRGGEQRKKKEKEKRRRDTTEVVRYPSSYGSDPPFGFSPSYKLGDPLQHRHRLLSRMLVLLVFWLRRGRRSCWTRWNIARNLNKFSASPVCRNSLSLSLWLRLAWTLAHERSLLKPLHTAMHVVETGINGANIIQPRNRSECFLRSWMFVTVLTNCRVYIFVGFCFLPLECGYKFRNDDFFLISHFFAFATFMKYWAFERVRRKPITNVKSGI